MKSDQMGTGHNNPSPRELPLSNQARFRLSLELIGLSGSILIEALTSGIGDRKAGWLVRDALDCAVTNQSI